MGRGLAEILKESPIKEPIALVFLIIFVGRDLGIDLALYFPEHFVSINIEVIEVFACSTLGPFVEGSEKRYKHMVKGRIVKICMMIALGGILGVVSFGNHVQAKTLTIGAPPSMKAALQEIVPMFEGEYGADVKVVYGASPTLRQQIENGAPIDVFLAASFEDVKRLHDKKMTLYGGPRTYAKTSLVLVMSSTSYAMGVSFSEALPNKGIRIALGDPHNSSLGKITDQALANHNPVYKNRKNKRKVFHAQHAEHIVNLIHNGKVDMGIVYRVDAINNGEVLIIDENPAGMHVPVQLGQAVVSTCREASLPLAQNFFDFLLSPRIQRLLLKYGFDSV